MTENNMPKVPHPPFLNGGGEMGELLRAIDWSATRLGQPQGWPAALKQTVSMMLSTMLPVLICWGDDYIQLYNDAFRPINGLTKHPQALTRSARGTYAEIWDTIGPMFAQVMNGQSLGFPDFRVSLNRNGYPEDCFFDFSYSPIRDENGQTGGILVICIETTERVRSVEEFQSLNEEITAINEELAAANEELAATNEEIAAVNEELAATNDELKIAQENILQSEKLFRSIVLNIPKSLIIVIDKQHRYVTIEGDIMEKMGYDHRDYEGKHPTEVGPPERYEASKHLYERVLAGEKFSVARKAENGEDYMVHFVPLKNESGEVTKGLIVALDVTDIKQGEERSAKLAAIVASSDDAIISKTLESVITSWNESAQRMFGYTADEIIGKTIYKLIPADRQEEESQILTRLKTGERVDHFETKRVTKDGRLLDVSISISPVRDSEGTIIGLSKIARDITEKKLDENRKNDFIGMVSHELKTPLTSLNALIQVTNAKLKNSNDTFLTGAMEKAQAQVKKMSSMINGFLNISRLESGKIMINKQAFRLDELIVETIDEIKLTISGHIIQFHSPCAVTILGDRDKIGSVISNLLSNAVKYSPKGKLIDVNLEITENTVRVSFTDEGMGIKPADLDKIFERYYRVETNHTQHISGFGIGLYLSSEIISRHDGKLWAESSSGVGSTFYFSLPLGVAN